MTNGQEKQDQSPTASGCLTRSFVLSFIVIFYSPPLFSLHLIYLPTYIIYIGYTRTICIHHAHPSQTLYGFFMWQFRPNRSLWTLSTLRYTHPGQMVLTPGPLFVYTVRPYRIHQKPFRRLIIYAKLPSRASVKNLLHRLIRLHVLGQIQNMSMVYTA